VNQAVRVDVGLAVGNVAESVTVAGRVQMVDTSTNALGRVVTGREILDLPLNGRNFTQLGLLQTGVAPLTAGVATAGGSLRQGQAYAVNGMRPEQNVYLVDGAQNINRMDGGYALKLPVDAIAEFRILTQSAPPEFGGTGGATTSVVTRSGTNQLHGNLYEFVRNDAFDAPNYFSVGVEPLKQHQFGVTAGGPVHKDRVMFFGYYEGFRNDQGMTTSATVPTARNGKATFRIWACRCSTWRPAVCRFRETRFRPRPSIRSRSRLEPLPTGKHFAVDSTARRWSAGMCPIRRAPGLMSMRRHRISSSRDIRIRAGTTSTRFRCVARTCPASPRVTTWRRTRRRFRTTTSSRSLSSTRFGESYLRHTFFFDQRLNQTPPGALGFGYTSANTEGQGPPFFHISGYSPIGGAITGPRNSTQDMFELQDALSWTRGAHLVKFGGGYQRTAIDMFQAIAPNAFYVFAGTFPTNNAIANLLLGAPVTFYQGLWRFRRGRACLGWRRVCAGRGGGSERQSL